MADVDSEPHCDSCGHQLARCAGPGRGERGLVCLTPGCERSDVELLADSEDEKTPMEGTERGRAEDTPRDWIFTFGSGHVHPTTGEELCRRFVRFHGTPAAARRQMVAAFGVKWSHQYASEEDAGVGRYRLTELDAASLPSKVFHVKSQQDSEEYLGDGVYATFDGLHVWLRADGPNAGGVNRIALEPVVFAALLEYQRKVHR